RGRAVLAAAAAVLLLVCTGLTFNQVKAWHDTEALCVHALDGDPANYLARNTFGLALLYADIPEAAEEQFNAAAEGEPRYAPAPCGLGAARARLGRFAEAEANFADAIRLDPGSVEAYYFLGQAQACREEWAPAADSLRRAVDLQPDNATLHALLGLALGETGR